jgi:methyl-accepting chemotaxis protein
MKLRGKILTMVIAPIVIFCAVIITVSSLQITKSMKSIVHNDLYAMAQAVQEIIKDGNGMKDMYSVDEEGNLWNGDKLNISSADSMLGFDTIKRNTDIDITIFYGDTRRATTVVGDAGTRQVGTQASEEVVATVLQGGQTLFAENVDVVGRPYFACYIPLYNGADKKTPVGMIFTGMPQSDVESDIGAILLTVVIVGVFLTVVCSVIGIVVVNSMIRRIRHGAEIVEAVAEGDLTVAVNEKELRVRDEVGDIDRAIANLQKRLSDIVSDIHEMCKNVNSASQSLSGHAETSSAHLSQIDTAVNEIAQGAGTQAEETQETTENVIVMGDMIEKNNSQIENLNVNAEEMTKAGDSAIDTLKELEAINGKTKNAIDVIYEQTNTTNESAMKIREAINLITDIAEETNLLSLNASIEAARAGEQGRGFAVVAGQIQKLAEQSNESARKIEAIVASLIEDSDKAVETMNEVRQIMEEQSEKVDKTSSMFRQLKTGIDQSVNAVDVIAESTKEIDKTRVNVVDSCQSLTSIAEENAASTEETSAAVSELTGLMEKITSDSKSLKQIAQDLYEEFQFFKVANTPQE